MEYLTYFLESGFVSFVILYFAYIIIMTLKHKILPKIENEVLYKLISGTGNVFAFFGILFDVYFNVVFGTVLFWELPHKDRLTLTARMQHILRTHDMYSKRYTIANWICSTLLNPFDMDHCK